MSCNSSEALFEAYLDATLLPAQRARLLAHLDSCGRCKGLLEELRVVDALLVVPRAIELPQNFTFKTMAEVRSLPRPQVYPGNPILAYIVSYVVASWLLIGAGFLFAWPAIRAFGETAFDVSGQFLRTTAAFGHTGLRVLGDFGSLGTLLGAGIAVDAFIVFALIVGFTIVRPRIAGRLRS